MKTFFKDFSFGGNGLINDHSDLEELIDNRQNKFNKTTEYIELHNKIEVIINQLAGLPPEIKDIINDLVDEIIRLESISYSAAYRDGMTDLMAAITLNKLNITKVEYFDHRESRRNEHYV